MDPQEKKGLVYASPLFLLAVLLCATFFLFYGSPDQLSMRSLKALWDLGHIVYFAVLVLVLLRMDPVRNRSTFLQWLLLLVLTLIVGALIEILQYNTPRTPDLADIGRDLSGCLLVLSFNPRTSRFKSGIVGRMIRLLAMMVLLVQLYPLTSALSDETIARFQFPVLSDFTTPLEMNRWDGGAGRRIVPAGFASESRLMRIDLTTERFSGVGMRYFPVDWRGFRWLRLKIYNPVEKSISITIRVHDRLHESSPDPFQDHDRFNRRLQLIKGWNEIAVSMADIESAPETRKMDLSRVADVSLFVSSLDMSETIYLDKIYLSDSYP